MLSLVHRPAAPLSRFVDHLWSFSDVPAHERERIIPCGTLELVVNLDEDEFRIYDAVDGPCCTRFAGAMVSGAYSRAFIIDTREHASVIGAHFKPGGALAFLSGLPLGALADTHVELETLWGRRARQLREELCLATSATRRFQILEQALLERLSDPFEHDPTVRSALQLLGRGRKVREVAADLAVSHRKLIGNFTAEIGLTPKLFARVTRFQRAVVRAQSAPEPQWSELALEAGYFDQSHLIRDFKAFSGVSPAVFRRQRKLPVKDHHVAIPPPAGVNSSNTSGPLDRKLVATRQRGSAGTESRSREC
jgi:AraC-like DNA-binding protein